MRAIARRLARLEKAIARPEVAEIPGPVLPQQGELAALAAHFVQSLRASVESYKEVFGLTSEEAVAKATAPSPSAENSVRRIPLDMLAWNDLLTLYRSDPAAALEKWMQTKEAARKDLQSGTCAAEFVQPLNASPWWLAQFLTVRDELADSWQSRSGAEKLLIDQAAQTYTLLQFWQEELISRTALANVGNRRDVGKEQVRLDDAQAIDQAMEMIERLNAMYLRIHKALQDLGRRSPRVLVRRANQVNVGQQQINLSAPAPTRLPPSTQL